MKLWEVLKAIEEGSTSVYVHDSGENPDIAILRKYADGWSKVKQPVTWQEAIEAWADGKKIRCKCEGGETFFRPSNVSSACFTAKTITHGTWYIED